jgi:hypothetical protein
VNCAPFLILYIVVALLSSACLPISWPSAVMEFLKGHKEAASLLSPGVISPVLALFALIVFAHVRGKRIGNAKLVWFPIAAIGLDIIHVLIGLLINSLISIFRGAQFVEFIRLYVVPIIRGPLFSGPMIMYVICCVVGGERDLVRATSKVTTSRER